MTSLVFDIEFINNKDVFDEYRRQYTSVERLAYNYIADTPFENRLKTTEYQKATSNLNVYLKSKNNVDLIINNSYLMLCLISNANTKVSSLEEISDLDKKTRERLVKDIKSLNNKLSKMTSKKKKIQKKIEKINKKIAKKQGQITHIDNKKYKCVDGTVDLTRNYTKQQWRIKHSKEINGHIITKEELNEARLHPVYIIGESAHHGNRLCWIEKEYTVDKKTGEILNEELYFDLCFNRGKKSKSTHIIIKPKDKLPDNYKKLIEQFYILDKNPDMKPVALTYTIKANQLTISYDEKELNRGKYEHIQRIPNRVMSIDNNPNYLGYSIVDWYSSSDYRIIDTGIYSIKDINDEWFALNKEKNVKPDDERRIKNSNKRTHEIFEITHSLIHKANYYKCSLFGIEDLNIQSNDRLIGSNLNYLCNNMWMRNDMYTNINKLCNIFNITCLDVKCNYSSIYGNIIFRKEGLSDPINAALEIGRRTYEYYNQYKIKTKKQIHNIIKPVESDFKQSIAEALEAFRFYHANDEVKCAQFNNLYTKFMTDMIDLFDLYNVLKKTGTPYRVPVKTNQNDGRFSSLKSKVKFIH